MRNSSRPLARWFRGWEILDALRSLVQTVLNLPLWVRAVIAGLASLAAWGQASYGDDLPLSVAALVAVAMFGVVLLVLSLIKFLIVSQRPAPRQLSRRQQRTLRDAVIAHGGQGKRPGLFFGYESESDECRRYAEQIRAVFHECGWSTEPPEGSGMFQYANLRPGITIQRESTEFSPPLYALLMKWFDDAGIAVELRSDWPTSGNPIICVGPATAGR